MPREIFKKASVSTLALLAASCLSACHSAYVQTSIVNRSGVPLNLVEVDYPSASFGKQQIADGATFHYRFKILDSGPVKISFTGPDNKTVTATGPTLSEGQQGGLTITVNPGENVAWAQSLSTAR